MPRSSRALLGLALAGCADPTAETRTHPLDGGDYWVHAPADLPADAPALFHLHHSGDAERLATDPGVQADLAAAGMLGVFPPGGGAPGDDWRVGRNKDDIPRDDRAYLAAVADDVAHRYAPGGRLLGGFSKGGAMVYDMACLGEDRFDGFVPIGGAFEDWIFDDCPAAARPIRHWQGAHDDKWPRTGDLDPESSHQGIVESMRALRDDPECMDEDPVQEGDCEVWPACEGDVRLCWYDAGHDRPGDMAQTARAWLDTL